MSRRSTLRDFRTGPSFKLLLVAIGTLLALAVALICSSQRSAAATQGPVAEYSFDQDPGEGTTIEDLTGDGHTATIHGATWAEHGRYGGAMDFDAEKGDYLSVPDSEELALTEEFTLEAWVRPGNGENFWGPLIDKQIPGEEGLSDYAYFLYASDYEEDRPHGSMPEGAYLHAEGTPKRVWSHVALTYDGGTIRLYVDGELVDEGAGAPPPVSKGELEIGGATEQGTYLDGRIDEVRIYERVLSQGEVDADMETPIEAVKSPPVAEYSFDQESETAVDFSGHKNEGSIEATEWIPNGRYGGALNFDGEESCVTVPDSGSLHPSEEFTLEAWVKPKDSPTADPIIFKAGEGTAKYAAVLGFGNYGRPQGWVDGEELKGPSSIGTDVWTHLAFTYDGNTLRLYVDGEVVDSEVVGELDIQSEEPESEEPLYIGCDPPAWGNHFHGKIDEPKIYERALLPWEVAADMEAPIETPRTEPIAAYAFDEGKAGDETAEDITGHGHTATIEGETEWTRGRYGGALGFEKEGDCATVAASPELNLSEEFTLEAWVRPEGGVFEDPVVVREASGEALFGIGIGSRGEPGEAEAFIGEGSGSDAAVGGPEIDDYQWAHIAATFDGAYIRLYVDGQLVDIEPASAPETGEGGLRIGCSGPEGPFWGRIDEVQVFDRAITAAEVAGDMDAPLRTPRQTPVAAYSFEEVKEGAVEDRTGDGHTATVEGATWTEHGRYGGALEFDAEKEDVVKIPSSPQLNFDEEFTLEAWVRPSGADNHHAPLIDKQEGSALGYFLYEGGTVSDRPVGAIDEEQQHVQGDDPLPAHAWSHVALTFTGNRTYLYVDGELVDNGAAEPVVTSEGELQIGGSTDTGNYFDGRIDEVRIYSRSLGPTEVATDIQAPIQTPALGPVAAYSFDEGIGTTVKDLSGEGHMATVEGTEWTTHGRYGEALQFNGTSSCVSIADAADLRLGEDFTLESWVRPEGGLTHDPVIFKEGSGRLNYALEIGAGATGKAEGMIGTSTSPNRNVATGTEALKANVWNHLAVTFDGSLLRLYVNGTLVDYEEVENADSGREGALKIGCDSQYGEHFKGRIDELRVYDRPLTAGEIARDMAPQGMTASYLLEEEEEIIQAEAISFYPETASGAPSRSAVIRTKVTLLGAPTAQSESGTNVLAQENKKEKPYQFAECNYSHHEPGVVGGKTDGPSRKVLGEIALEAAKDAQKAAKTTKPHGLPKCDGTLEPQYFNFQWGDEIWGDFYYIPNEKVWIEEAPQCEAWAPEGVELEWEEYEQKVREHRNPHRPKRQNAKPKEELCYAPHWESTKVPGGIDVVSRVSWTPAFLFRNGGTEREKVCGEWEGHLTANPPIFQENGLRQVYKSHHLHFFYEPKGLKCDWGNPGGDIKSEP